MEPGRPSLSRIRESIVANVARDALTIYDIAGAVNSSRSQVQRVLAAADTSYTELLRRARIEVALRELVAKRHSARRAAAEAGITRDHLCVLLKSDLGLSTRQILRARDLEDRIDRWRREVPPLAGTKLYYRRRRQWLRTDAELRKLLEDLDSDHPLAGWAKQLLVAAARPDYRRGPYRQEIQRRRREAEIEICHHFSALMRAAAGQTPTSAPRSGVET